MRRLGRVPLGLLAPVLVATSLAVAPSPAHADGTGCVTSEPGDATTSTDVSASDDEQNAALRALRRDDVHRLATGRGVRVAVIDSGVQPSAVLSAEQGPSYAGTGPVVDGHGTIVAGLIAGRGDTTGLAPGATIVSLRVSSSEPDQDDPQPGAVSSDNVARAIDWAVGHDVRVINLSLGFEDENPAITRAIERAVDARIVVVAAAGNRPPGDGSVDPDEASEGADRPEPMPDEVLFPATLDDVIAVTGRAEDLSMTTESVLTGPEVDVSAPVVGLRSVMLRGIVCDVATTASSWATAEVSALAALILERDPSLTTHQVKTRIEVTAQGGHRDSATDGHGMIQPHEALTAVLDIAADGTLRGGADNERAAYEAAPPEPEQDHLARSRDRLLWWGVGGGGAVLLALMLRPLTARRRSP